MNPPFPANITPRLRACACKMRRDTEYWLARPLAKVLDYSEYRHFLPVVERIAQRVAQGGHNIPEEVIRRRFTSGQANLARYCALVDEWDIYDNSGPTPLLINERTS